MTSQLYLLTVVALRIPSADSSLQVALSLIWRFSPDIIAILCALLMTTDGPYGHRIGNLSTFWGVPSIVVAFMVVSSLQRGNSRNNLSRLFLESPPMNLLGYISYPTCNEIDLSPNFSCSPYDRFASACADRLLRIVIYKRLDFYYF